MNRWRIEYWGVDLTTIERDTLGWRRHDWFTNERVDLDEAMERVRMIRHQHRRDLEPTLLRLINDDAGTVIMV